ncbi:MAG: hypothetical protein ACQEQ4_06295 [Fibrobacterota bacterium]
MFDFMRKWSHAIMLVGMLILGGVVIWNFGRVMGTLQWIIAGTGVTLYVIGRIFASKDS